MCWTCKHPRIDYQKLTNEELHALLWELIPEMKFMAVGDDTRETVIAMLKIRDETGEDV